MNSKNSSFSKWADQTAIEREREKISQQVSSLHPFGKQSHLLELQMVEKANGVVRFMQTKEFKGLLKHLNILHFILYVILFYVLT